MASRIISKADLCLVLTPSVQRRIDTHLGRRIRTLRRMRSATLLDVATLLNRSVQQVSRLESGACRVSVAQLYMISTCYGARLGWFFHGLEEMFPDFGNQVRERLTVYDYQEREESEKILLMAFRTIKSKSCRRHVVRLIEGLANEL